MGEGMLDEVEIAVVPSLEKEPKSKSMPSPLPGADA